MILMSKTTIVKIQDIVLLGGGYVNVWAYRQLEQKLRKQLREGKVRITLVSSDTHHSFHGFTNEILSGSVRLEHPHSDLRKLCPKAAFVLGKALKLEPHNNTVEIQLEDGQTTTLHYDQLLLGVGSHDRLEIVPGQRGHTFQVKDSKALQRLLTHLDHVLEQALTAPVEARGALLSVVVVGAGFVGVETCTAIAERWGQMRQQHPILRQARASIHLLEAGSSILHEWQSDLPHLAEYAERQVKAYGIDLRLNTKLECFTAEGVRLSTGFISAATVISTIGQAPNTFPGTEGFSRASHGRILTDQSLRILNTKNLWTGGDVAHVEQPGRLEACPPNALWAIQHGIHIGNNISAVVLGRQPKPFTARAPIQAASFGIGKAALELYGLQLTGWLAWIVRLIGFLSYVPSRHQAYKVFQDVLGHSFKPSYKN